MCGGHIFRNNCYRPVGKGKRGAVFFHSYVRVICRARCWAVRSWVTPEGAWVFHRHLNGYAQNGGGCLPRRSCPEKRQAARQPGSPGAAVRPPGAAAGRLRGRAVLGAWLLRIEFDLI